VLDIGNLMVQRAEQDELDSARAIAAEILPALAKWTPYETYLALQLLLARDLTVIGITPEEAVAMVSTNVPKFMEFCQKAMRDGSGLQ
jgi:hypothetical protein